MRIGVLGAGAIGGTVAALLDRAGHRVSVTARGEHLEAIRRDGLRLTGGFGEHRAHVAAGAALDGPVDLAVVATKAADAAGAISAERPRLGGIPVVVIQNGLDGLDTARGAAPEARVVGGLSLVAASFLSPGEITVTAALPTLLGRAPEDDAAALTEAIRVLGTSMPVEAVDDFRGAQWTKLLINQVNALPAITGLSVQETVAHPRLVRVLTASMRETIRLARVVGIRFATVRGIRDRELGWVGRLPLALGAALPRAMARSMGSVPNPGSTLQSIRRGRPTEVDALNGAVVRVARDHGRSAPINAALTALVHEVERTGRFLTPDEVAARIPVH